MELFILYIWLKLNTIIGMLAFTAFILMAVFIIILISTAIHNEKTGYPYHSGEEKKSYKSLPWWKLLAPAVFCIFLANIIPNQTQTAVLVGGHYALKIVDSPEAAKVMSVLRLKANEMLDAELEKATPKPKQ